ncbi:MAG TPA: universal stress protein [Sedimentibacter sp.]|nr:universal stress protein [Sedimentibacter sp.]HOH70406.1 universal stress protein [Sedimentibacter sp.]
MKLLVPVDGSNASISAVKKALELARQYGFAIKLISVVTEKNSEYRRHENAWRGVDGSIISESEELEKRLEEKIKENAQRLLDAIVSKLDFSGIRVEKEVLLGEPYAKIIETAKNDKIDIIVMSNRGFSKVKRFFVGSVTQKVISDAPCPVLVVNPGFEP